MWTTRPRGGAVGQPEDVRWDALFEDMEAQLAALGRADLAVRVDDLTRSEQAGVPLAARLRGASGEVALALLDGTHVRGTVVGAADQWLDLADGARRHLVPLHAVAWIRQAPRVAAPAMPVTRRLGLGHAFRALARDRVRVVVRTPAGSLTGWVARVGRDHVDLDTGAERPGQEQTTVPFERVLCVSEVL